MNIKLGAFCHKLKASTINSPRSWTALGTLCALSTLKEFNNGNHLQAAYGGVLTIGAGLFSEDCRQKQLKQRDRVVESCTPEPTELY